MVTFETVLDEILDKLPKTDKGKKITVAKFADETKINPTLLSRLKNSKAALSDEIIEKIIGYLANGSSLDKRSLGDERKDDFVIRISTLLEEAQANLSTSNSGGVKEAEKLFEKIAQEKALLIVDYRDLPQAAAGGAFPNLGEKIVGAIKEGLCMAMFQPFGKKLSLSKKHVDLLGKIGKIADPALFEHAKQLIGSYDYLVDLATKVEAFYLNVKKHLDESETEVKGQVVLYEAAYRDGKDGWSVLPSMIAGGIQSRLFYANFLEGGQYKTKIFEWVTGNDDEHLFIERSKESLKWDAALPQFNPIPAYWRTHENRLPETDDELDEAYEKFGLQGLLAGKDSIDKRGPVKWEISKET